MKGAHKLLQRPESIACHKWQEDITPLVSISCITYNHEKYIRKAIKGFLLQKTTFRVEILLHDDASTDATADIIREYESKYPDLVYPMYQTENQYRQGNKIGVNFQYPRVRGKYIAKCEGDDYWNDPFKLQKQIDFLENNPGYSACFTNAQLIDEMNGSKETCITKIPGGDVVTDDIIRTGGSIYPSAALVYRRDCININLLKNIPEIAGDTLLIINLALNGKIYFFDECSCVYRRWGGGVYSSILRDPVKLSDWRKKRVLGYKKLRKIINKKFKNALNKRISADSLYVALHTKGVERLKYLKNLNCRDAGSFVKNRIRLLLGERISRLLKMLVRPFSSKRDMRKYKVFYI